MKLLVWNIEGFNNNKFVDHTEILPSGATKACSAQRMFNYIQRVVTGSGSPADVPDIIAIIEVLADGTTDIGQPLTSANAAGLINLLSFVKDWTRNPLWRLVPPLKCNPRDNPAGMVQAEAVGVLYNSQTFNFTGPIDRGIGYPPPWDDPNITNNTHLQGQIDFIDAGGHPIHFPRDFDRRPFLVDFQESGGTGRIFRCCFVHPPKRTKDNFNALAVRALANIREMQPVPGGPSYYVFSGDFNVDAIDGDVIRQSDSYDGIRGNGYIQVFTPAQESTHLQTRAKAIPCESNTGFNLGGGYMQRSILDNFFIHIPSPNYTGKVINAVKGFPPPYRSAMSAELDDLLNLLKPPFSFHRSTVTEMFRTWENFGCIVGSSDHAPILLEIP